MQGRSCFLVITGVSAGIPEKAQGTSDTAMWEDSNVSKSVNKVPPAGHSVHRSVKGLP